MIEPCSLLRPPAPRFQDGRRFGTEAGRRKLTGERLERVGLICICGKTRDVTNLSPVYSAQAALRVGGSTDDRLRLAHQPAATVLNDWMSDAGLDCTGINIGARFTGCDNARAATNDRRSFSACIADLHRCNRDRVKRASGVCQVGTGIGDGVTACRGDDSCSGETEPSERADCDVNNDEDEQTGVCARTPHTCRQQPLVNTNRGLHGTQPGKAGTASGCKQARKNACAIFSCN